MSEENKAPTPSDASAPSDAPAPAATPPAAPSAPARAGHDRPSRPPGRGPRSDRPGPGGPGGPRRGKRQFFRKKKVCRFCADRADFIDYKKADILRGFVQERGKILPRRMTGTCSRHQRWLGEAIKRARNIALLPFGSEL